MGMLVILLDGAAEPKRSAYKQAKTPFLDKIASKSMCGLWEGPVAPDGYNVKSLSEIGMMEIFGYSPAESPGRGFMEALALGVKPRHNAVYFRANFATVDDSLSITDRRAGRDESGLDEISKSLSAEIEGIKFTFAKGKGHRGVVVLEGRVSKEVTDVDTGESKPQNVKPKSEEAEMTSIALNKYLEWSHSVMSRHPANSKRKVPANYLLLRSPGMMKPIEPFRERFCLEACAVGNDTIFNGMAKYLGMKVIATGEEKEIEGNIEEKLSTALGELENNSIVFLHIKGADTYSHNKDFSGKSGFIEELDMTVFSTLFKKSVKFSVISDHATDSETGEHCLSRIPFLVYNGKDSNNIKRFNEEDCKEGFFATSPIETIIELAGIA